MHPRLVLLAALGLALAAVGLGNASAQPQASPTYLGRVSSGGSVQLVLRADRKAVTRVVLKKVVTPCSTISSTTNGRMAIVSRSFSLAGGLTIKGTFNAAMTKASGTLAHKDFAMPSCSAPPTRWSASRRWDSRPLRA